MRETQEKDKVKMKETSRGINVTRREGYDDYDTKQSESNRSESECESEKSKSKSRVSVRGKDLGKGKRELISKTARKKENEAEKHSTRNDEMGTKERDRERRKQQ